MQIIITGGGGFLGQKLASALLNSSLAFNELFLVDLKMPARLSDSPRLRCMEADLTQPGVLENVITANTSVVYHLAAIVSSHAEDDFDLGWKVNLDLTRQLLEACRRQPQKIRFVFSSSLAVYGGTLPECVTDTTALTPRSSYGAQKAACELLVNDYTRKGYVDGLALRLPTICVRPGLVIVVEHIDLVAEWPEGAALHYRERQQLPGQAETVRWSTVILKRERGRIVWRHLHETTVTA
ncbi:TPA_asm: NAD-dependent epimerase/dehydratase family protein [Salmonella enterica]|nr:hypothetical protein [Salmonella enterica]EAO7617293.1 hypothetical protein [Salmonella enterica]EAQ6815802.1 hypothetical protein [Salmonella enterica]EAU9424946.1 NAD-dependent epimerase/dehydratase family protein [Salmonella enterica]EBQ2126859.1 NAD-dependent epimerase/dehydratase family protein [Salmonella enterica]